MKELYVCETYYHLLVSIVKNIQNNNKNDLFIFCTSDNKISNNSKLIEKIKNSKIFNRVTVEDHTNELKKSNKELVYQIDRIKFINKNKTRIKKILDQYDNIYMFNDITTFGKIVNAINKKYILLEDGIDCYINNKSYIKGVPFYKKIIKKILYGSYYLGSSKNVLYIEVNNLNGVFIKNQKLVQKPKKDMFNSLSKNEKKIIANLFIHKKIDNIENSSLLITQPLWEDKLVSSKEKQISIYKTIVEKYICEDKIVVKTHPRENIDYSSLSNNIYIFEDEFPLEILNFFEIPFNRVITISSTAIEMIDNCKEKIILGWDWLYEQKGK